MNTWIALYLLGDALLMVIMWFRMSEREWWDNVAMMMLAGAPILFGLIAREAWYWACRLVRKVRR